MHILAAFRHHSKVIIIDEGGTMWEFRMNSPDMPEVRRLGHIPFQLIQAMEEP